jgi:PAS domain S-box-containing protein
VVSDERGKLLFFNPAAEDILGAGMADVEPEEWSRLYEIFMPDQVTPYPPHEFPLSKAIRGETVTLTEIFVRNQKTKQGVWASATARPLRNEAGDHCGGLVVFRDETRRKQVEIENQRLVAERNRLFKRLQVQIEQTPLAYILFDADFRITDWNPAAEKIFGYSKAEALAMQPPFERLMPESFWLQGDEIRHRLSSGDMAAHSVKENSTKDGRTITCEWFNSPLVADDGRFGGLICMAQDITERKAIEEQLWQAQKAELFGKLAGGVAHDFNNLLTIISGCSQVLLDSAEPDDPGRGLLQEICKAGERSAALTRQLLAFSRRQVMIPKIVDLREIVDGFENMIRRVLGADVELITLTDSLLDNIRADPGQLEQVLLNLAVNSRYAMPQGGKFCIETRNVELDADHAKGHVGAQPGPHVVLVVTDSGSGMTPEVMKHIFEPFFTTKPPGEGTGMGLASVIGIVEQSGGHITVSSTPDKGTEFRLYFPSIRGVADKLDQAKPDVDDIRGNETVLIADDEEVIRLLLCRTLEYFGYSVLSASDGSEALALWRQRQGPIRLAILDLGMPKMSGSQTAETLLQLDPALKVLYVSGSTDDTVVRHAVSAAQVDFMQKPYLPKTLARKVREILDRVG